MESSSQLSPGTLQGPVPGHLGPVFTLALSPSPCRGEAGGVSALSHSHCVAAPAQGGISRKMQKVIWLPSN